MSRIGFPIFMLATLVNRGAVPAANAGPYPLPQAAASNSLVLQTNLQAAATAALSTNAPLKQVGDGLFELGRVRLDKTHGTVQFPASVNMSAGLVEYFLVHARGKVHESVLRTDVEPMQIHLARLLLSRKDTKPETVALPTGTNELSGEKIDLSVSWSSSEFEKRARAEDLVWNTRAQSTMTRGQWIYNGSRIVDGVFLAERGGSIVSIIADPDALVNNPRPGRDNDEIWRVNTNAVPPLNTPVQVTIQFETNDAKSSP